MAINGKYGDTRKFGGKVYSLFGTDHRKQVATRIAKDMRARGWKVRTARNKFSGTYLLYRRRA